MLVHIGAYFSRLRHIQDPCITGSNKIKQHLLFKTDLEYFFIFASKVNIQNVFLQESISIITITIITACHPSYHATHATHPSNATYAKTQRKLQRRPHTTHASKPPTPPKLGQIVRHLSREYLWNIANKLVKYDFCCGAVVNNLKDIKLFLIK